MKSLFNTFKELWFSSFSIFILVWLFVFSIVFNLYFFIENPVNHLDQEQFKEAWIGLFPYLKDFNYFSSTRFFGAITLNILSLILVIKTIITGKCSLLKGFKLVDIIIINALIFTLTIPFFCEFCFFYGIIILSISIVVTFWKISSSKFDNSCACQELT